MVWSERPESPSARPLLEASVGCNVKALAPNSRLDTLAKKEISLTVFPKQQNPRATRASYLEGGALIHLECDRRGILAANPDARSVL